MKRLLAFILLLSLLVVTGTIVAADGQTRRKKLVQEPVRQVLTSTHVTDVN